MLDASVPKQTTINAMTTVFRSEVFICRGTRGLTRIRPNYWAFKDAIFGSNQLEVPWDGGHKWGIPMKISPQSNPRNPKLMDRVRDAIRLKHYSIRTEKIYCDWIRRFILFHRKRHPQEMAEAEVTEFLTHLARDGRVASSTQNQALSALLFLYKEVLRQEIGWLDQVERAKRPTKLPVVLSRTEVEKVLGRMSGTPKLMASLLYGSGLRLMECVRLRVKDIDFAYTQITVRDARGG